MPSTPSSNSVNVNNNTPNTTTTTNERSSSAVRNLRSMFENKANAAAEQSPDTRGRSQAGLITPGSSRPTSKVRANFISVDNTPSTNNNSTDTTRTPMASIPDVESPIVNITGPVGSTSPTERRGGSNAGLRRGSFSEPPNSEGGLTALKKTVSQEAERREKDTSVAEAIPEHVAESAAATPLLRAMEGQAEVPAVVQDSPLLSKQLANGNKEDKPPANPDKPVTAAEEEPAEMKPAELSSAAAVSGGEALPPAVEDLRPSTPPAEAKLSPKKESAKASASKAEKTASPIKSPLKSTPSKTSRTSLSGKESAKSTPIKSSEPSPRKSSAKTSFRPTPVNTQAASRPTVSSSLKSPTSQMKKPSPITSQPATSSPNTVTPKSPVAKAPRSKPSRSSLTAPTASSAAKSATAPAVQATSPKTTKPKPREGTKPVDLPSRLTAPTAASRAKHESSAPTSLQQSFRSSTAPRSSLTASSAATKSHKPTRSSLASSHRPGSRTADAAPPPAKKLTKPSGGGSFLDRMTRPTAASANKAHDKFDPSASTATKSPPRATTKSKLNGHTKKPATSHSRPSTAKSSDSVAAAAASKGTAAVPVGTDTSADDTLANGNGTPQTNGHTNGTVEAGLEATPGFEGNDMAIR